MEFRGQAATAPETELVHQLEEAKRTIERFEREADEEDAIVDLQLGAEFERLRWFSLPGRRSGSCARPPRRADRPGYTGPRPAQPATSAASLSNAAFHPASAWPRPWGYGPSLSVMRVPSP